MTGRNSEGQEVQDNRMNKREDMLSDTFPPITDSFQNQISMREQVVSNMEQKIDELCHDEKTANSAQKPQKKEEWGGKEPL